MKLVTVFESNLRIQAQMAVELLESEHVDAMLFCDDAGGLYPGMEAYFGCQVQVRPEDVDKAKEILASNT